MEGTTQGRRTVALLAFAVAVAATAPQAAAGQFSIGADATYNNQILSGSWGFGGRLGAELPSLSFVRPELIAGFVYYLPSCGNNTCDWWEAQGTLLLYNPRRAQVEPYFGIGASYHQFNLNTSDIDGDDYGIDVLLGAKLGDGTFRPYGEIRYKIMAEVPQNQFAFTFGLRLGR